MIEELSLDGCLGPKYHQEAEIEVFLLNLGCAFEGGFCATVRSGWSKPQTIQRATDLIESPEHWRTGFACYHEVDAIPR